MMEQTKQHEYVDLGLPSGLKWATMNVGATRETDYGYYFQWGDVEDKSSSDCSWKTYKHCSDGIYKTFTKYCADSGYSLFGTVDDKITLDPEDDVARVHMGGDWRMPTEAEVQELINNTDNEWAENFNGSSVNGRKFTSKTDESKYIFIPASGGRSGSSFYSQGSFGCVWSSSFFAALPNCAWDLYFDSSLIFTYGNSYRYYGFPVRGVFS